jgi:guanine deaminase
MSTQQAFMKRAAQLSIENIEKGGGPFGAVIVKNGQIIAEGVNGVTRSNDPTAHAEMTAIRDACAKLKSFSLEGCEIYTSCEPCPMCFSAIYWARIDKIYYSNSKVDAANIDFDDQFIYDEIARSKEDRKIPMLQIFEPTAKEAFNKWQESSTKIRY